MNAELQRVVTPPRMRVWDRGEWFLYFDPANFNWTRVNASGRFLMELLRKHWSVAQIAAKVAHDFNMTPEAAGTAVQGFVDNLVATGFLHVDEYRLRERRTPGDREFPSAAYLHMTNACNLKCPYCYNKDDRTYKMARQDQFAPTLTTEEYKHLITRLIEEGIERLFFTGGEPLMRADTLELAAHARALKPEIGLEILTNGILIKGDRVKIIAELFDAVTISLDGHERHLHEHFRGHNTFAPTVAGVRRLVKMKKELGRTSPHIALVPALTELNIGAFKEIVEFVLDDLEGNGLAPIIFQAGDHQEVSLQQIPRIDVYAREVERTRGYLRERRERKERELAAQGAPVPARPAPRPMVPRDQCGFGHAEISVDPSGVVYPCQSLQFDEFACGNVRDTDVRDIFLNSPILQRARGTRVQTLDVCRHCDLRDLCNGGCRATAYNVYRDLNAHNEIYCRHLEYLAVENLWGSSEIAAEDAVALSCSPN